MDMLSGSQIDYFLSATSLVWASSIVLIMVGLVYYIKYRESHNSIKISQFFGLYLLTFLLNILEYILNIVMHNSPPYETIIYKTYILLKFLWNLFIMFYVIYYININSSSKMTVPRVIKIILMVGVIICSIMLDVDVALESNGKFYVLVGTLNNVFNIYAIISNSILLIIVLIFRRKLPKVFCVLSLLIFFVYISILIFKHATGYIVNDSVFIYSLLVLIIFNTTSNQDKEIVNKLKKENANFANISSKRNKLINVINYHLDEVINNLVLYNDELYFEENHNRGLIKNNSIEIKNDINELTDYLDNVKDIDMIELDSKSIKQEYQLNVLVSDINSKVLSLVNLRNVNFNIMIEKNTPLNYIGDMSKIERLVINILEKIISNTSEGQKINLVISTKQYDLNNIELIFNIINSDVNSKIDLNKLSINDYLDNNSNEYDLKMIVVNELLTIMNSIINININENNIIYSFSIVQGFMHNEFINNID